MMLVKVIKRYIFRFLIYVAQFFCEDEFLDELMEDI